MDPLLWLSSLPLWLSCTLLLVLPTALTWLSVLRVRQRVGFERLRINNEVAGFLYAVVSVLYALVLGFVLVVLWQNFEDCEDLVQREADALVGMHLVVQGFPDATHDAVDQALTRYLRSTAEDEWPSMQQGASNPGTRAALEALFAAARQIDTPTLREQALFTRILDLLVTAESARRDRLADADGALPGIMWVHLFVGGLLTVGFTLFFGATNPRAQAAMTACLTASLCLVVWLCVALNHPFSGRVSVSSDALKEALVRIEGHR
jgi:hypothetical protein